MFRLCTSCQKKSPSPSPRKSPSPSTSKSPNYGYNLKRLFGEKTPRNTRKTPIPPQVMSLIASKLKKGTNVRRLVRQLPESYARYVTLRKPPATKSGSLYKAKRKAGNVRIPYNKKHLLNAILPVAYKRNNWTHYSINGPLTFFNANGTPFSITKKGTRKAPRFVPQNVNIRTYERKPGNNWASYQKRANKYTRYVRGAQTRRNILDEIEEAILGGAPNKYLYNANEVQNKWIRSGLMEKKPNANKYRWTNRALLFYLAKRHSNNYGKVPGYGITRRNGPIKMTRANILENLKMLHPFFSR